jgi:hypothetical protein
VGRDAIRLPAFHRRNAVVASFQAVGWMGTKLAMPSLRAFRPSLTLSAFRGIYFEDPSQTLPRGYLTYPELQARWHDTGRRGKRIYYYGVSIWKKTKHVYPQYLEFATHMP